MYGADGGRNNKVDTTISTKVEPLRQKNGRISMKRVFDAGKTTSADMSEWRGIREGICANYSAGYCGYADCKRRHLQSNECPQGYAKTFCNKIDAGVTACLNDGNNRSPKKQKTAGEGEG